MGKGGGGHAGRRRGTCGKEEGDKREGGGGHVGKRRGAWGKEEGDMREGGGGHVGKRSNNAPLPFMLQKQ